ncbi:hypothetical protein [Noviherbaspirillum sp.]|uniref:hypothetical protein n=1 Tax=Noviherbaspirillum sp. TaxID=1926288 RepID=UPI002FE2C3B6
MPGKRNLSEVLLKGAVASIAGGLAIKLLWEAGQRTLVAENRRVPSPTTDVVRTLAARKGMALTPSQEQAAAGAIYGATMLAYGALYGIVQSRFRPDPVAHGLLLAGIMYAANFPSFGALPRLGILPSPREQTAEETAIPIVAQAAYGLVTAYVFHALDRDRDALSHESFPPLPFLPPSRAMGQNLPP